MKAQSMARLLKDETTNRTVRVYVLFGGPNDEYEDLQSLLVDRIDVARPQTEGLPIIPRLGTKSWKLNYLQDVLELTQISRPQHVLTRCFVKKRFHQLGSRGRDHLQRKEEHNRRF